MCLKVSASFAPLTVRSPSARFSYAEPQKTLLSNVKITVDILEACTACPSVRSLDNVTTDRCYLNIPKGEQLRDYHIDDMSRIISQIFFNSEGSGIFIRGSGRPISVRAFVGSYIRENFPAAKIELNLGYYDYPELEPMAF